MPTRSHCRAAAMALALSCGFHALPARASMACPLPLCDPQASDGGETCAAAADWIVEGRVVSVQNGSDVTRVAVPGGLADKRPDGTMPRQVLQDIEVWDRGTVVLENIQVIKGVVPSARRSMTVKAATPCWKGQTYVYEGQVGKRILVYGSDIQAEMRGIRPGDPLVIFAVRELDAHGNLERY